MTNLIKIIIRSQKQIKFVFIMYNISNIGEESTLNCLWIWLWQQQKLIVEDNNFYIMNLLFYYYIYII